MKPCERMRGMEGGAPPRLPSPLAECAAPGRAAAVGGRGRVEYTMRSVLSSVNLAGGLYLREPGVWGQTLVSWKRQGTPGGGDPRGRAPGERGEAQLWFCSRGGSEAAGGVREGTAEARRPRRGKRGLHERLPHRAARRRDAHRARCHVDGAASSPGAPSSLEAVPGTVRTAQFPQRRRTEHAPISQPFLAGPPAPP